MMQDRTANLKRIRDEVWNFTDSPLYTYRKNNHYYPVLGEGNHEASIMFIGEAPGKNEAETGKPFCGAAGKVLDTLLSSIGLDRKNVYVTNIVKDRPPNNRDPEPDEIALYAPFLKRQIAIIQPKVIATLGRFSMWFILDSFGCTEKNQSISQLHGKCIDAKADYGPIHIVPLYHPAVALYKASALMDLKKDFQVLKQFLA